jgi:hypothetical protein
VRALPRWLAGCACLLWLAPAGAGQLLERFMALQVGEFDSTRQARLDTRYEVARWHIVEIWPERADPERWVYVESWMEGAERPYLQRIASFIEDGADAAVIGEVIEDENAFVQMDTAFGGRRVVDWLTGDQLPRIC